MDDILGVTAKTPYGDLLIYRRPKFAHNFAKTIRDLTYEQDVVRLLQTLKYDYFVDVGACFGYHSLIASKHCRSVDAFEPHPLRFGFANWNLRDIVNVHVFPFFVGLNSSEPKTPESPAGMVGVEKGKRVHSIHAMNVDLAEWLRNRECENILVKVDTEGFELDVLKSAGSFIGYNNIKWIVEIHPWGYKPKQIFDIFEGFNHKQLERKENNTTTIHCFWKGELYD